MLDIEDESVRELQKMGFDTVGISRKQLEYAIHLMRILVIVRMDYEHEVIPKNGEDGME